MNKPFPGPEITSTTHDQLKQVFSVPAPHANRVFVTAYNGGIRLTLGEDSGRHIRIDMAAFLQRETVVVLHDMLDKYLKTGVVVFPTNETKN